MVRERRHAPVFPRWPARPTRSPSRPFVLNSAKYPFFQKSVHLWVHLCGAAAKRDSTSPSLPEKLLDASPHCYQSPFKLPRSTSVRETGVLTWPRRRQKNKRTDVQPNIFLQNSRAKQGNDIKRDLSLTFQCLPELSSQIKQWKDWITRKSVFCKDAH